MKKYLIPIMLAFISCKQTTKEEYAIIQDLHESGIQTEDIESTSVVDADSVLPAIMYSFKILEYSRNECTYEELQELRNDINYSWIYNGSFYDSDKEKYQGFWEKAKKVVVTFKSGNKEEYVVSYQGNGSVTTYKNVTELLK